MSSPQYFFSSSIFSKSTPFIPQIYHQKTPFIPIYPPLVNILTYVLLPAFFLPCVLYIYPRLTTPPKCLIQNHLGRVLYTPSPVKFYFINTSPTPYPYTSKSLIYKGLPLHTIGYNIYCNVQYMPLCAYRNYIKWKYNIYYIHVCAYR